MATLTPLLTLLPPPNPPDSLYLPASEQPAQRLMDASAEALSDGELLSLVLGNKTPEQSLGLSRRLLRDVLCTIGLADRSQVHAREVFREAVRANCTRIILVHNHPGGDATPSPQDVECTRGLVAAGKVVGIEVLDHVVPGPRTPAHPQPWFNLRQGGLM